MLSQQFVRNRKDYTRLAFVTVDHYVITTTRSESAAFRVMTIGSGILPLGAINTSCGQTT
jgi:hypothetical protein